MKVFRLYFKPHNRSQQDATEAFVRAPDEATAVIKVLKEMPDLTTFSSIMIDVIENGVIIGEDD